MTMTLDIVPSRGGNAAIILRHHMVGADGAPVLVDGDPGQVISLREKIRELLSSIENPQRKARKKPKAAKPPKAPRPQTIKEEAAAEVEAATQKRKRIPNLTPEHKRIIVEMSKDSSDGVISGAIAKKLGLDYGQVVRYWESLQPVEA